MTNLADKLDVAKAAKAEGADTGQALDIFEKISIQQESVARALPVGMDAGRFIRMVLTEMRRTPKLATCDPSTLIGAMMLSAQTGLEPGGPLGHAFLIPRWSKKSKTNECSFQIGYRGYVQLAARSGVTVVARTVREGDEFDWAYGTDEYIDHRPPIDSDGPAVAWYAKGEFADGRKPVFVVIGRSECDRARVASQSGDYGPWATHYNEMARKTAVMRLAPFLPLATDAALAIAADGAVASGTSATVEDAAQFVAESVPEIEDGDPEPEAEAES